METTEISIIKPVIKDFQSIDFNELGAGQFEKLLYQVYKRKIVQGEFTGQFDAIWPMSGSKDRGRDCTLFYNGQACGLIQCKKYASTLKCDEAAKEVLKFVMWSFVDERILYFDEFRDFVYMLATARGVEEKLVNIVMDFSNWLIENPKLKNWFNTLKNSYAGLNALVYEEVRERLADKLRHLKVVIVPPDDIVLFLVKHEDILSMFFSSLLNLDGAPFKSLEMKSDRIIHLWDKNTVDKAVLKKVFDEASATLMNSINGTFFNTGNYHAEREETVQIFDWICTSASSGSMALVTGDAGCGKSVVIKDLKLKCDESGIPVLAIKAEYIKAESVSRIEEKLNIPYPIVDSIRTLAKDHDCVVVFIDQIDALSQYLSANRDYIYAFGTLISQLQQVEHVKTVISTRTFDCDNDAEIGKWKEKSQVFSIGLLSLDVVEKILKILGCNLTDLSSGLQELLRTPVYLDVFCRIYTPGIVFSGVNTVVGLYDKLWEKFVLQSGHSEVIKKLLCAIADEMHTLQEITIPARKFREQNMQLFGYLQSSHLIEVNNGVIQMFHQSFYDYVYARHFIENSGNVLDYVCSQRQNINIRSSLKMILTFLRDYDCIKYRDTLSEILTDSRYKFHIKHLVYAILGSQVNPVPMEFDFVRKMITEDRSCCKYFLRACTSVKWMDFVLLNPGLFLFDQQDKEVEDIHLGLICRFLNTDQDRIITFIGSHRQFSIFNSEKLLGILGLVNNWGGREIDLLEKSIGSLDLTDERHIVIAGKIVDSNFDYIVRMIENQFDILMKLRKNNHTMVNYRLHKLFKALYAKDAVGMCDVAFRIIDRLVAQNPDEMDILLGHKLVGDKIFEYYEYCNGKEHDNNVAYSLANLFITAFIALADSDEICFEKYLNDFMQSDKWIWLYITSVILTKYTSGKSVFWFMKFMDAMSRLDGFSGNKPLQYNIWHLIESKFDHLDQKDRKRIVSILLNISPGWEKTFSKNYHSFYLIGMTAYQYLRVIPKVYWKTADREELGKYLELSRRWGANKYIWRTNRITAASIVGAPLLQKAYECMSPEQWIKSFYKYNSTYKKDLYSWPPKGNIDQHSKQFEEWVKKSPEKMCKVVVEAVRNKRVDMPYKIGGLSGLIRSGYDKCLATDLFTELTGSSFSRHEHLRLMWAIEVNPEGIEINECVFSYIVRHATENMAEEDDDGSIGHAVNSLQGSACVCLIALYDHPVYKSRIIPIIKKILQNGTPRTKVAILHREAYLMNIDREMAFELFLDCVKKVDSDVIYTAQWSLQYFYFRYAERLVDFFDTSIPFLDDHTTRTNYTIFVTQLYMEGYVGYDGILNKLLEKYSGVLDVVFEVALAYYNTLEYKERSLMLLRRFFGCEQEEICENYELAILRRDEEMEWIEYRDFIEEYVKAPVFCSGGHQYLADYLFEQSSKYPRQVLDILDAVDIGHLIGEPKNWYRAEEKCMKIVLCALNYVQNDPVYVDRVTDVVDHILMNSRMQEVLVQQLDNR